VNINALYTNLFGTNAASLSELSKISENISGTEKAGTTTGGFENVLGTAIEALNNKQVASNEAVQGLIMGDSGNLHDVMIQSTEAQLSLELAVQIRNKSLEAFNEIKNMQF
jgi:flagellar hook-basal body complex protein FliE